MDKIIALNHDILGPQIANREQIEDLITLLVSADGTVLEDSTIDLEGDKLLLKASNPLSSPPSSSSLPPSISSSDDLSYSKVLSSATVVFGPSSRNSIEMDIEGDPECNESLPVDLNKATDEELVVAKAKMSVQFEENRLKPGDNDYVWDKQVSFAPPEEASEWDDD